MTRSFFFTGMVVVAALVAGCGPNNDGETSRGASSSGGEGGETGEGGSMGEGGTATTTTSSSTGGGAGGSAPVDLCADVVCNALNKCHVAGVCDPATGKCSNPLADDGTDCGTCGACTAGVCGAKLLGLSSLQAGTPQPSSITFDAQNIYVTNLFSGDIGKGTIETLPKDGGDPVPIITGLTNPSGLSHIDNRLYYADAGKGLSQGTTDGSAPPQVLIPTNGNQFHSTASYAFRTWVTDFAKGQIIEFSKTQGINQVVASGLVGPAQIKVDATNIYWINGTGKSIAQMPRDGGPITTLVANIGAPNDLDIDDTHVYFADGAAGTVNKVPIGGGAVTTLATGQDNPKAVTVRGKTVYWGNYGNGSTNTAGVAKTPVDGGAVTPISGPTGIPVAMTSAASCVYWVDVAYGGVFRAQ